MSWTNELYQVYENFHDQTEFPVSMVPIYHSSTKVQIEISIREDGEFSSARRLTKEEELTVLPVTEDSGARSSGIAPMPFTENGKANLSGCGLCQICGCKACGRVPQGVYGTAERLG